MNANLIFHRIMFLFIDPSHYEISLNLAFNFIGRHYKCSRAINVKVFELNYDPSRRNKENYVFLRQISDQKIRPRDYQAV